MVSYLARNFTTNTLCHLRNEIGFFRRKSVVKDHCSKFIQSGNIGSARLLSVASTHLSQDELQLNRRRRNFPWAQKRSVIRPT